MHLRGAFFFFLFIHVHCSRRYATDITIKVDFDTFSNRYSLGSRKTNYIQYCNTPRNIVICDNATSLDRASTSSPFVPLPEISASFKYQDENTNSEKTLKAKNIDLISLHQYFKNIDGNRHFKNIDSSRPTQGPCKCNRVTKRGGRT